MEHGANQQQQQQKWWMENAYIEMDDANCDAIIAGVDEFCDDADDGGGSPFHSRQRTIIFMNLMMAHSRNSLNNACTTLPQ